MKYLSYILAGLIAVLPMIWIDNYTISNPVWWTVVGAWHFGRLLGMMEAEDDD